MWKPGLVHGFLFAGSSCEADDGSRTRDLRLGKPTLYQLSYVRKWGEMLAISCLADPG
jgi:hypothetical protein